VLTVDDAASGLQVYLDLLAFQASKALTVPLVIQVLRATVVCKASVVPPVHRGSLETLDFRVPLVSRVSRASWARLDSLEFKDWLDSRVLWDLQVLLRLHFF